LCFFAVRSVVHFGAQQAIAAAKSHQYFVATANLIDDVPARIDFVMLSSSVVEIHLTINDFLGFDEQSINPG